MKRAEAGRLGSAFVDRSEHLATMKIFKNKDFAYAMSPLRIISWPIGIWPLQEYNVATALRSTLAICILTVLLILENTEIYLDPTDAEKVLDALLLVACGTLAICKVTVFRIHSTGLAANFVSAVKDYEELDNENYRLIMGRHAYMGRMSCFGVLFFTCVASTLMSTVSMLATNDDDQMASFNATSKRTLKYPIPSEYTLKTLNAPRSLYPVIFVWEYFMLLVTGAGNLGSDGLFYGIVFHVCGQAEILKQEFTKSADDKEDVAKRFIKLAKRHYHLVNLSQMLNDTISSILIVQLFTSCILICTSGFQFILSFSVKNSVMVMKTFIVMCTILSQMFAYSYVGEYLKTQMESIGYSAYCSSWYNLSRRVSKDIIFILLRAQYPVQLRAGKFFVINMETYMSILRTSMSYLSVLRVMVSD